MYRLIANSKMNIYKCPKCETEFSLGTKFCENCGCNFEVEFIETPMCPKCKKTFPTGTIFCSEDGTKLVSPEQMIPKCVKCEKVYTDGTKFCPLDGGKIIPEALRTKIDFDNAKELLAEGVGKGKELLDKGSKSFSRLSKNQKYGIIGGCVAIIALLIVLTTGGSPGRQAARDLCRCYRTEQRRVGGDSNFFDVHNVLNCFNRKLDRHRRHIEANHGWGSVRFKNPRHQKQFNETRSRCLEELDSRFL